jgi:hypothetical protein
MKMYSLKADDSAVRNPTRQTIADAEASAAELHSSRRLWPENGPERGKPLRAAINMAACVTSGILTHTTRLRGIESRPPAQPQTRSVLKFNIHRRWLALDSDTEFGNTNLAAVPIAFTTENRHFRSVRPLICRERDLRYLTANANQTMTDLSNELSGRSGQIHTFLAAVPPASPLLTKRAWPSRTFVQSVKKRFQLTRTLGTFFVDGPNDMKSHSQYRLFAETTQGRQDQDSVIHAAGPRLVKSDREDRTFGADAQYASATSNRERARSLFDIAAEPLVGFRRDLTIERRACPLSAPSAHERSDLSFGWRAVKLFGDTTAGRRLMDDRLFHEEASKHCGGSFIQPLLEKSVNFFF